MSTTYLLISDDLIPETQEHFAWSDALAMIWSGDFSGTPRLIRMDLDAGTVVDETNAALVDLADRAHREGETPKFLEPLFRKAGLDFPTERAPRRYQNPAAYPVRVGSVLLA